MAVSVKYVFEGCGTGQCAFVNQFYGVISPVVLVFVDCSVSDRGISGARVGLSRCASSVFADRSNCSAVYWIFIEVYNVVLD